MKDVLYRLMMGTLFRLVMGTLIAGLAFGQSAWAFDSKGKVTISEVTGGVTESVTLATALVQQGSGTDAGVAGLSFGTSTTGVRDSGASIRVTFDSNATLARLITYTDNKNNTGSVAKSTINAETGVDSGGLTGQVDRAQKVDLLYSYHDTNIDRTFDNTTQIFGSGPNGATTVSDRDHVMSFAVALGPGDIPAGFGGTEAQFETAVDNANFSGFPTGRKPTNADTDNDGLYPQMFGAPGPASDLTATITDPTDNSTHAYTSQELSKNYAVIGFSLLGTAITVIDRFDSDGDSNVTETVQFTSPIYLPIGADFRNRPAQDYKTNTHTVEIVSQ